MVRDTDGSAEPQLPSFSSYKPFGLSAVIEGAFVALVVAVAATKSSGKRDTTGCYASDSSGGPCPQVSRPARPLNDAGNHGHSER